MNKKHFFNDVLQYFIESIIALLKIIFSVLPKGIKKLYSNINKRLRFSITFKTTTIYTLIFSSLLFTFSLIVLVFFSFNRLYEAKNHVENSSALIEYYLKEYPDTKENIIKRYSEAENLTISIFDDKKKLSFSTGNNYDISLLDSLDSPFIKPINNELYLYINKKISIDGVTNYIQLNKNPFGELNPLIVLAIILILNYIISILITIRIGSKTIKRMLRPIDNITFTAKSITAKDLHTRLDVVDSHDELKDLAETINSMLDGIETAYEQQNRFVSDASHELRTPISVIQGYANLLSRWGKDDKQVLEESVNAIKNESENMKGLVEKLLFLARADKNTQRLEKEQFYMNELIDEIVKDTKLITTDHSIINITNDSVMFFADKKLIKQCLRIFIDNSIKYTPVGGSISINSSVLQNRIIIIIEDTGEGISKEDLPNIFDRFYRCDKARSRQSGGTGLGLSIAKWIVGSHNGSIEVESSLNKGTKIIITFPI